MAEPLAETLSNARLWKVLEEVRQALKSGNYPALDALIKEQNSLIDHLIAEPAKHLKLTETDIENLLQSAERNRQLLVSAMDGLNSATRRYSDVREAFRTTKTYDRRGRRAELEPAGHAIEKRS